MTAALAIARQQLRIVRRDPWFFVIMMSMPLVVMPLLKRTMQLSLLSSGYGEASGAEQVVPGQIVLFGFMVGGSASFALFREHGWRTWDRLRASAAPPWALLAGFAAPWVLIHLVYQLVLFMAGAAIIGLRLDGGSPIAALAVMAAYGGCVVALVLLAAATFRTVNQVQALVNVGAMVFGGLGGAFVPLEQLPGWAQAVAPVTPSYWAMNGFNAVFLDRGGVADVVVPVLVLVAAASALFALAVVRFRVDETKEFFA